MLPTKLVADLNEFYRSKFPNIRRLNSSCTMEIAEGRALSALDAWFLVRHKSEISDIAVEYVDFIQKMLNCFRDVELFFIANVRVEADHKDAIARPQGWAGFGCLPLALALYTNSRDGASGAYVECGVFRGGSLACMSHVCRYLGTTAFAADTFEGLPEDDETGYWKKRQFLGPVDEVKATIEAIGAPEAVKYKRGLFHDTLPDLGSPVSVVFLDTDLYNSSRSALTALSPNMMPQTIVASDGVSGIRDFRAGKFMPIQGEAKAVHDHFEGMQQPIHAVWTGNGNMCLFRAKRSGTDLLFSSSFMWQLVIDFWAWKKFEDHVNVRLRQDQHALTPSASEQQILDFIMADALQRQIVSSTYIGHLEWLNNQQK